MDDAIELLIKQLEQMDCGDNSCTFAKNKTGMRTNGGCRCIQDRILRRPLTRIWYEYMKGKK